MSGHHKIECAVTVGERTHVGAAKHQFAITPTKVLETLKGLGAVCPFAKTIVAMISAEAETFLKVAICSNLRT
jgi:hypothetical protein